MSKILAIANHKGGVGKTTTTATVGAILANKGFNTLVVDLDPQANLTRSLLKSEPQTTIYEALTKKIETPVINVRENLDIIPSGLQLAKVEIEIAGAFRRENKLQGILNPLRDKYSYILIDCPPSLGLLLINALVASTNLVIPVTPEALPTGGLNMIKDVFTMVRDEANKSLEFSAIIITRWDGRRKVNRSVEDWLRNEYGDIVLKTHIRDNVSVMEAPLYHTDVTTYSPASNGAKDYEDVTEELLEKLRTNS